MEPFDKFLREDMLGKWISSCRYESKPTKYRLSRITDRLVIIGHTLYQWLTVMLKQQIFFILPCLEADLPVTFAGCRTSSRRRKILWRNNGNWKADVCRNRCEVVSLYLNFQLGHSHESHCLTYQRISVIVYGKLYSFIV